MRARILGRARHLRDHINEDLDAHGRERISAHRTALKRRASFELRVEAEHLTVPY